MRILMVGGGTLGSVTPLLAVAEELAVRQPNININWIGTSYGPEQKLIRNVGINFKPIVCGRWRRYFSVRNILDIFRTVIGFFQSLIFIHNNKPQAVVSAGSYVAVPVVWAAWILRIPIFVHQQDLRPGLANKLVVPIAKVITLAWPDLVEYFSKYKAEVIGNPVRRQILGVYDKTDTLKKMGWSADKPVILVMGGGTGAEFINILLIKSLPSLSSVCNVIHITGSNKSAALPQAHYKSFTLAINELPAFLQVSDLVITRAGMGTISELSAAGKPAVIIPIPQSHQELNAEFVRRHDAAVILNQKNLDVTNFIKTIKDLLSNQTKLKYLSDQMNKLMPRNSASRLAAIIIKHTKQ